MTGWTTREEHPSDIQAIRHVNTAAMSPLEADLVDALRADETAWVPGLSHVAEAPDGSVVGYLLLSRCHIDETPALAIGPMAVTPSHQKQGVGGALMTTALTAAKAQGWTTVVCLGHPEYYPRYGFQPAEAFGIDPPVPDWRGPAYMVLPLASPESVPTGTVRYPQLWGIT